MTVNGPVVVASHRGYQPRPSGQPVLMGIGGCCARESTPSLAKMLARCRAAVAGLIKSKSPSWRLLWPRGEQAQALPTHAESTRVDWQRLPPVVLAGADAGADAVRAEATDSVFERRPRLESFEDGCRAPHQSGIVALGQAHASSYGQPRSCQVAGRQ